MHIFSPRANGRNHPVDIGQVRSDQTWNKDLPTVDGLPASDKCLFGIWIGRIGIPFRRGDSKSVWVGRLDGVFPVCHVCAM